MIAVPAIAALAAPPKVIVPANGVPPVGPYSPGLEIGGYVYVSGQGVRNAQNQIPEGIAAQTRQCIANVRGILQAAGLTLDDVVSVQLFLADLGTLSDVEELFTSAFPKNPPRVTLGVARMPTDTTVEITVVARRAGTESERVYVPAVYGNSYADVNAALQKNLKRLGLAKRHIVFTNRYVVGGSGKDEIPVAALPGGVTHAVFAIASRAPLVDAAFCEVRASDPKGTAEEQTANAFGKLKSCLTKKGMTLENVVATNVYVDNLDDFARMNAVYATFFPGNKPTRTTIQPVTSVKQGSLVRLSGVAVK